jgi:hypothetical protein
MISAHTADRAINRAINRATVAGHAEKARPLLIPRPES